MTSGVELTLATSTVRTIRRLFAFAILMASLGCARHALSDADRAAREARERAVIERHRPFAGCYSFRAGPWQVVSTMFPDTTGTYAPAFVPPQHLRLELENKIGYAHLEPQPDSSSTYYKQAGWVHVGNDGIEATLMLIWLSDARILFAPSMSVYLIADSTGYHGRLRVNTDATQSRTPYRAVTMVRETCP